MKLPRLPRFTRLFLLLAAGVFAGSPALPAADAAADSSLVIAKGVVSGVLVDGRPMRATLRNLADELMRRYPPVTINLAGVEEVVVDDLTLRMPRNGRDQTDGAVNAVLNTLVEVTEGGKFSVAHFSENQFLLSRPRAAQGRSGRNIEVFNLKVYLEGTGDKAALETEVRQSELRHVAARKRFDQVTASFSAGLATPSDLAEAKDRVAGEENHLNLLIQKLRRSQPSREETAKRIDELLEVVNSTLAKFSPGEKAPAYEYHPGTYLLIVIGSDTAIDVTRKVVTALEKSSN